MHVHLADAYEIVTGGGGCAPVLLTCEHASERLPEPWSWPPEDRWLVGTHWAYDIAASDLTRALAEELEALAVLSRFSRLLVDANRPEEAPDLFRQSAEGRSIGLNRLLERDERQRRLDFWHRYHQAVDEVLHGASTPIVLSVHSFTPVYEGAVRDLEIGVLFDREEALAKQVRDVLVRAGFVVRLNEPYSGREGLIYSADRHARAHGRQALELEVRQDLAVEAGVRHRLVEALAPFLASLPEAG